MCRKRLLVALGLCWLAAPAGLCTIGSWRAVGPAANCGAYAWN